MAGVNLERDFHVHALVRDREVVEAVVGVQHGAVGRHAILERHVIVRGVALPSCDVELAPGVAVRGHVIRARPAESVRPGRDGDDVRPVPVKRCIVVVAAAGLRVLVDSHVEIDVSAIKGRKGDDHAALAVFSDVLEVRVVVRLHGAGQGLTRQEARDIPFFDGSSADALTCLCTLERKPIVRAITLARFERTAVLAEAIVRSVVVVAERSAWAPAVNIAGPQTCVVAQTPGSGPLATQLRCGPRACRLPGEKDGGKKNEGCRHEERTAADSTTCAPVKELAPRSSVLRVAPMEARCRCGRGECSGSSADLSQLQHSGPRVGNKRERQTLPRI